MKTTTRTAAAVAAPVLALSLLAGAPAQADAPKITNADFLTGAQVGKHFGDLKASKLDLDSTRFVAVTATCDTEKRYKVKRDKIATYATAKSKHLIQVAIYEMKSTSDAKAVLASSRRELSCGFVDIDGGAHIAKTAAPKVGNESVGQLIRWDGEENEPARMARYVFRKKNRVISVLVVGDKSPSLPKSRKLAAAAYKVGI